MTNPYSMPQAELTEPVSDDTYSPKFLAVNGRIGRVRYLGYSFAASMLLVLVIIFLMGGAGALTATSPEAAAGLGIFSMLSIYALSAAVYVWLGRRRLHDLGHNGWLSLILLIPFIGFFFGLWLLFGKGDSHANEYGPAPGPNSTGVIILACGVPVCVVLIGILAAIAIPAYADYTKKAQAAQLQNGQ